MTETRQPFRAEVSRLLDLVVHSLYSEKQIFLRELISNASDACDKLRYEALTTPELIKDDSDFAIQITVDPKARTVTVSDNGIGMTRDELVENLGTIARSGTSGFLEQLSKAEGKPDINLIGQFGVGFYAAFMVAQMVEVKSRKAGSEEAWCWRSDGKGEFAIEEDTKDTNGTEVVLYLKQGEDEFLLEDKLRAIVLRYSDHIAIPIRIGAEEKPANRAAALWLQNKNDITSEQYKEFYHHVAHAFEEPALTLHWKAEGKIEYTGLLFVPGVKPYDLFDPRRRHSVKLYVKRVFITDEAEGLIPPYLRFLRGIVDSEDLPLNISREMLQHNPVLTKIRHGVVSRVLNELNKFAEHNKEEYAKVWANFGAVIKEGLYEDGDNRAALLKLVRCRTSTDDAIVSLADYVARMKNGQDAIYYINGDNAETLLHSPHLEGFRAKGIEVLLLTDPVDDFWPGAVGEFEGKKFRSVTRAAADLGKIEGDAKDEQKKKEEAAPEGDLAALIVLLKKVLGDQIKDVQASDRLTDSAVCLGTEEGDIDIHLEKFLKQHNQIRTPSRRILEINPRHALIKKLVERAQQPNAEENLAEMARLLLDQALLMDGETIADPVAFGKRLAQVMAKAV